MTCRVAPHSLWSTVLLRLLAFGLLIGLWGALLMPGDYVPSEISSRDLLAHAGAFFAVGLLLFLALRRAWIALMILIATAIGSEYLQLFTPGRQASVLDALADLTAIGAAAILVLPLSRLARRGRGQRTIRP